MGESEPSLLPTIDDAHLAVFAHRLTEWLTGDLNQSDADVPQFTESRAKALLRAADAIDDPTRHNFARLIEHETAVRLALHDLLKGSGLAENDEVIALAATSAASNDEVISNRSTERSRRSLQSPIPWMALATAAFAWQNGYPLHQLDPASPPETYSPAGQLIQRAAHFIRQQVQRSATERDKLGRKLAYGPETAVSTTPNLDALQPGQPIAPVPPHFRPPIPVNYPEMARETMQVDADESTTGEVTAVSRTPPITITGSDLPPEEPAPVTMPPIRISEDQLPPDAPPHSRTRVITPNVSPPPLTSFTKAVRQKFGRSREPFTTTKLRIVVQEYADGPGLYGLQVRVTCQGVRSFVAGTTNRDGKFLCELPVRVRSGLTYDVDVTWPRDLNSEVERKSITINADRTEFSLPFYRRMKAEG